MKQYSRIIVLFVVVAVIVIVFNLFRQAAVPESAIIQREKNKFASSFDQSRAEKDPVYAAEFKNSTRNLAYHLAVAYNKENKPDEAIALLKQLIQEEASGSDGNRRRRSRSYLNEARYYETLHTSYRLKHNEAEAERALEQRNRLLARAEEAKRKERLEDGKSVGLGGE